MTRIEAMREAIRVMEKERRIYSIRCEGLKPAPGGEAVHRGMAARPDGRAGPGENGHEGMGLKA